ncbi:MAG: hypothetical protein PHS37_07665 [Candidatus Omnitrophica bacterium]|nr:hypothetical protein [Candidatus Omnitrophota bacterium]
MAEIITKIIEILSRAAFPAVVFTIASNITFKELVDELKSPSRLIRMSIVCLLVVPVVTIITFKFFRADIVVTGIALIAAIAPGDSFALLEAENKRARVTLAAVIMAWLCLVMPVTAPAWLTVLSRIFPLELKASPNEIFWTVAPLTVFPLALGILFHEYIPKLSDILKKITGVFFKFALIVVTVTALMFVPKGIVHFNIQSVIALCLTVTIALFMGYYCGLPDRKDRWTSALTASLGNFALVLLVAHLSYPKAHIVSVAVVFILIRWFVILLWYLILRSALKQKNESL